MNNEIDRDSMLIYLNDLRVMETIVKSDKQKILSISDKLEEKEKDYKFKKVITIILLSHLKSQN